MSTDSRRQKSSSLQYICIFCKHAKIVFMVGVPVYCSKQPRKETKFYIDKILVDDTNDANKNKNIQLLCRLPSCGLMVGLFFFGLLAGLLF